MGGARRPSGAGAGCRVDPTPHHYDSPGAVTSPSHASPALRPRPKTKAANRVRAPPLRLDADRCALRHRRAWAQNSKLPPDLGPVPRHHPGSRPGRAHGQPLAGAQRQRGHPSAGGAAERDRLRGHRRWDHWYPARPGTRRCGPPPASCSTCSRCWLVRYSRDLERYRYLLLLVAGILLVAPLFFSPLYGARLWIHFGSFSFQPVEFSKILLCIFFASYFAENKELLSIPDRADRQPPLPRPPPARPDHRGLGGCDGDHRDRKRHRLRRPALRPVHRPACG